MRLRLTGILLLVSLFIGGAISTAWAAESWVTDLATGAKIGWISSDYTGTSVSWTGSVIDGKAAGKGTLVVTIRDKEGKEVQGTGEVEMVAGLLDGKVTLQWSDGDFFDGYYIKGLRDGKGLYKWADGRTYEGDWKNGNLNGYGILKDPTGKVLHDGPWKDGQAVIALKTDKVLGIPWGASLEEAKRIMLQRPATQSYSFMNGNDAYTQWKGYYGPYADFNDAEIWVHFYQNKMCQVQVSWALKEDQVLERFNVVKQGLTERYGTPIAEKGKYLDSLVQWDLGGGYSLNVQTRKNTIIYVAGADPTLTHPFRVFITYYNQSVYDLINKTTKPGGISKDY